jgi:hypothetical protein
MRRLKFAIKQLERGHTVIVNYNSTSDVKLFQSFIPGGHTSKTKRFRGRRLKRTI